MDGGQAHELEEARILLQARREIYGEADPAMLDAMLHLGRTLRDAGELHEAEHVLTTLLSVQHRAGDEGGDRILGTEFNLAIVLDRLGEYDAARRVWGASWGPRTGSTARTANCPSAPPPIWPSRCASNTATATNSRSGCACSRPRAHAGARRRRDVHGADRVGPDAAESRQSRDGAEPLHRGPRRPGAHGSDQRAILTRSGPSRRSWWRSSDRRRPPRCSIRS